MKKIKLESKNDVVSEAVFGSSIFKKLRQVTLGLDAVKNEFRQNLAVADLDDTPRLGNLVLMFNKSVREIEENFSHLASVINDIDKLA